MQYNSSILVYVSLFQDYIPWLSRLNMIFEKLKGSPKSLSLTLDSVIFNNSCHEIYNINMEIINCTLTNYKLLFKGAEKSSPSLKKKDIRHDSFKHLSINHSKLQNKIIGKVSPVILMNISRASVYFYNMEIYGAKQDVSVIEAQESKLFFMYCNFNQNAVNHYTQAVIMIKQSKAVIANSTFTENVGHGRGIIYAFKAIINMTLSSFERNQANYSSGGVIYSEKANITILNSIFKYNKAYKGGVIYVLLQRTLYIYGGIFVNNSARNMGGVLFGYLATRLTIEKSKFALNSASDNGGCISVLSCKVLNINNSYFDSSSGKMGGAIFVENATYISISNTHLNRNMGEINTGALRIERVDRIFVSNCRFTAILLL